MAPESSTFRYFNCPENTPVPSWLGNFTLKAPTGTDLWRKPSRDTFTAPVLYTTCPPNFFRAEVSVHLPLPSALEWDQGGLVIFAGPTPVHTPPSSNPPPPPPPGSSPSPTASRSPLGKWVKAGIEFSDGRTLASSVSASSDGADWSLVDLPAGVSELKVRFERVNQALWVWFDDGVEWRKLREVNWFFYGVEEKGCRVGVYASRPARWGGIGLGGVGGRGGRGMGGMGGLGQGGGGDGELVVEFEGLEVY